MTHSKVLNFIVLNSSVDFRAAEVDVEAQRQELMTGFDDSLCKREHEFRNKLTT